MLKIIAILILLFPTTVFGDCTCESEDTKHNKEAALKYKLGSIASILVAGAVGVSLPLLGKKIPTLRPEHDIFFMIKAFAAGVILATGFIHILPDAFDNLTSPCLKENPWGNFPFTGFVAMLSAIGTLMVDSFATSEVTVHELETGDHVHGRAADHVHGHTHATQGHHGHGSEELRPSELIRHRLARHLVGLGAGDPSALSYNGISLSASQSPETIKPLMVALSFHQFFEGMGLGGCISQGKFKFDPQRIWRHFSPSHPSRDCNW
ncbi:zinc transporter 1-like [Prunus yedoensis var. nudiflora]|uniref:Zinc transporter 1-like n=1 Tax=Prunus yedoensis var. nudiflora TaxID=2094558 RepID=A0A314ZEP4_PRUYE|nr:zinc transporter 1-like [Prunus yedoensis var. nudiflora]